MNYLKPICFSLKISNSNLIDAFEDDSEFADDGFMVGDGDIVDWLERFLLDDHFLAWRPPEDSVSPRRNSTLQIYFLVFKISLQIFLEMLE